MRSQDYGQTTYDKSQAEIVRQVAREDAHTSEGIKSLLAINGGGAISMLGFMQAILLKGAIFQDFKQYGLLALGLFAVGILFAALVPAIKVVYINKLIVATAKAERWEKISFGAWALSLAFFCCGAASVAFGISIAIH